MKTINPFKKQVSLLLAILVLYSSCSRQEVVSVDQNLIDKFSGEDIFKGLFFSEGDFVKEVPTLNRLKIKRDIYFIHLIIRQEVLKKQLI